MEADARTYMSPRRVLQTGQAHCVEGAMLAAAALAFHGERPLLLDFQAAYDDEGSRRRAVSPERALGRDQQDFQPSRPALSRSGSISSVRSVAASYFHASTTRCMGRTQIAATRQFSRPFDLAPATRPKRAG